MAERFTEARLDAVLASVGTHLVVPDGARLVAPVGDRRPARSHAGRLALAAAVLLVVLIAVGALVTPVRDAVADWLGIGNTRVEQVPARDGDPAGLPMFSADAIPTTATAAAARLGRPIPVVRRLGRPERFLVPPEGGVLMAWPRGRTTLWVIPETGEGPPLVKKLLTYVDHTQAVEGLGEQALLVDAAHVLETPTRRVAAGRVLLWIEDGLQYRLESDLSPHQMIELAQSVRARR